MNRSDFRILPHPDNRLSEPTSVWKSCNPPYFCVEHIPTGEVSQYEPYDVCQGIIEKALKGELMGTFGLGKF